jgi:hypothetical protein
VFDARFRSAHDSRVFDPRNDYDMFLASGVITLAMVRVFLAAVPLHHFASLAGGRGEK